MIPFIIVGSVGLLILLISMLLGDLFDFLDIFDGALSGTAVGSGLTVFGATGLIVTENGGPIWLAYAGSTVLCLAAILVLGRVTREMQAASVQESYDVVGLSGIAVSDISPEIGEVQLQHPREINKRLAISAEEIPAGTEVTVVSMTGSRVKVTRAA